MDRWKVPTVRHRVQVGGRAVEHIHHQFHATGFDPVADDVAQQAVAADQRIGLAAAVSSMASGRMAMRPFTGRCSSLLALSASSRL